MELEERPLDIPQSAHKIYAIDGWKGYEDWIGKEINRAKNSLGFSESRDWMRKNNKINPKTGEVFINTQQMFNKWGKFQI